ncbi:MAG: M50 family metallopeptidase [Verrucomicrobiota bacterium]
MSPTSQGAFRLFRAAGIDVFLHWSWLIVGVLEIEHRRSNYSSLLWNVLEYLTLFFIVLLHEFGHALACRQVGGQANQIILWPLGGVAYVTPPPRPGATLWSIAAGPLVNVLLIPVLMGLLYVSKMAGWSANVHVLLKTASYINLALLIFNVLPIYPLDGGQILRSLLWFRIGPIRSLLVATSIGFVGAVGLGLLAFLRGSIMTGVVAAFVFMNCHAAWSHARALARAEAERRPLVPQP